MLILFNGFYDKKFFLMWYQRTFRAKVKWWDKSLDILKHKLVKDSVHFSCLLVKRVFINIIKKVLNTSYASNEASQKEFSMSPQVLQILVLTAPVPLSRWEITCFHSTRAGHSQCSKEQGWNLPQSVSEQDIWLPALHTTESNMLFIMACRGLWLICLWKSIC